MHEHDEEATPEERAAADALRDALEGGSAAPGSETARLAATARLIAGAAAPPLSDLVRERLRRRIAVARRHPARGRALAAAALALAAGVAVIVLGTRTPTTPATPYARVFERPFTRSERPQERIARMLAWRRGELDRKEGR